MNMPVLGGRMAQDAAHFVLAQRAHSEKPSAEESKYLTWAQKFPALLHSAGLQAAFAFAVAKSGKDDTLQAYIAQLLSTAGVANDEKIPTAINTVREHIRQMQHITMAAALIKRFAEAALRKPETESDAPDAESEE